MKRLAALFSLILLPALASAGTAPTRAADGTAVTTVQVSSAVASPATVSPATAPAPLFLTGCTISVNCYCFGGTFKEISCSGTTCEYGPNRHITCDGFITYCPPLNSNCE